MRLIFIRRTITSNQNLESRLEYPYIGIDESNHGGKREIVVAVISYNPSSIVENKNEKGGNLRKIRGLNKPLEDLLNGDDFRFLFLERGSCKNYGYNFVKLTAIERLVTSFGVDLSGTQIIVDGDFPRGCSDNSNKEDGQRSFYPTVKLPRLKFVAHADVIYPIVNKADEIASLLRNYYRDFKSYADGLKYEKYKVGFTC